jgi:hypothetical protein
MTAPFNFVEIAKQSLSGLNLQPLMIDPDVASVEVAGGRIRLEVFTSAKISKAVFSTIEIDSMSVSEQSVILWPQDGYDLPIFWCNLTQMPGLSFHIFDLIPLMDIVVWQEYGEKYLLKLPELRQKAEELLGSSITEKNFVLSSLVGWTFSPYRILFKLNEEGVAALAPVVQEYAAAYHECYKKAEPVTRSEERAFAMRRREAARRIMKENDPGYPLMTNLFGEDRTAKIFDVVF